MNENKKWLLVSFVGTGDYDTATYKFEDGHSLKKDICGMAIAEYQIEQFGREHATLLLVCTKQSYEKHGKKLKTYLDEMNLSEDQYAFLFFDPNELTTLFSELFEQLKRLTFSKLFIDITNTFRSIPFYLFPEFLFYKEQFNVEMKTYYAHPKGNPKEDGYYSVDTVSASTEIIEWLFATRMFLENGDGSSFTRLLKSQYEKNKQHANDQQDFIKLNKLNQLAKHFELFTLYFNSNDVFNLGMEARTILNIIREIEENGLTRFFDYSWVLHSMLERIKSPLQTIRLQERKKLKISLDHRELERQQNILKWYMRVGNYDRAVVLAREFIVNCHLFNTDVRDFLDLKNRQSIEEDLNKKYEQRKKKEAVAFNELDELWTVIIPVRNYISHCGQKHNDFPKNYPSEFREILSRIASMKIENIMNEIKEEAG